MNIKQRFLSTQASCRFLFKDGHEAVFSNGEYLTKNEVEIEELTAEIDAGHPTLGRPVNQEEWQIDVDAPTPKEKELMERGVREYLARVHAGASLQSNDRGNYQQGPLNPVNSATIAGGASGSDSGAIASAGVDSGRMAALKSK
jgi:hypothetical protein